MDVEQRISSKQKGDVTESRVVELVTLGSVGQLTCYTPTSDDDGIDLIINKKGDFKPIFIQVKSRFKLAKGRQFIQNVGLSTFKSHKSFYIIFIYFNENTFEVECVWLIPSVDFERIAYLKKSGKNYKSFYRFAANPLTDTNQWSKFRIPKEGLGQELLQIMDSDSKGEKQSIPDIVSTV
ncbi:hypothetical protein GCM10011351_25760 [Paraliobacillus quinghaiensis]|uniref:DUF4365 domain-containing protein n=1 Tax=Paraliobacillus quinghaiensis TaxID=470815 RepID=A0A917WXA5_9BACI|nr:restriction endonuclease [Paraliobacillus quinghaiensis]GGM38528.1 hypothetical protein GCM10011351_25760 [Paraliobacillus quinghaiensis]